MSDIIQAKGSCLCGSVAIEVKTLDPHFGACHCHSCQKWAGGPLLSADCGEDVDFTGSENISVYASSEWAERGFCAKCGSHLFFRFTQSGQYIMPIGLFDLKDTPAIFDHQMFIDQKPDYYDFANTTTLLTGDDVFADFMDEEEE